MKAFHFITWSKTMQSAPRAFLSLQTMLSHTDEVRTNNDDDFAVKRCFCCINKTNKPCKSIFRINRNPLTGFHKVHKVHKGGERSHAISGPIFYEHDKEDVGSLWSMKMEIDPFLTREMPKLEWLYSGENDRKYKEISAKRLQNTGNWFLESKQYQQWVDITSSGSSLLVCYGRRKSLLRIQLILSSRSWEIICYVLRS